MPGPGAVLGALPPNLRGGQESAGVSVSWMQEAGTFGMR